MVDEDVPTGVVCFSGGKDSTAMLLRMLELDDPENYPVTRIVFADTTFEFPELYEYLDRVQAFLDVHYPDRGLVIEKVHSENTWDDWFYGVSTRGASKGKQRGAPLKAYPCWWSREAKITPIQRASVGHDFQFVGIAYDEQQRISPKAISEGVRYPLNEWKWTEADCMDYLDHHGIGLVLYNSFDRIGCFHCPKQHPSSWMEVWKQYPDLWEIAKHWDRESIRITDRPTGMCMEMTLEDMEERFKQGWRPKRTRPGAECGSCSAVALHADGTVRMEDFDTDDAIEHDDSYRGSKLEALQMAEERAKTEWVPPSHLRAENVEAASFTTWFGMPPISEADDSCFDIEDTEDDA